MNKSSSLLDVRNLRIETGYPQETRTIVDGLSFSVESGECFALVGESGSGKTMTAFSILGLLELHPGITAGQIIFDGVDLIEGLDDLHSDRLQSRRRRRSKRQKTWQRDYAMRMKDVRGSRIGMIFQEPGSSLDPYFTVGEQMIEVLLRWKICSTRVESAERATDWLSRVAIRRPSKVLALFPHELSGGMCQRIMIAIALSTGPDLIVADEPTTALDVTIQKEIILLLKQLQDELSLAILFITHDIRLARSFAQRAGILYQGRLVDSGPVTKVLYPGNELHPFTRELLSSITGKFAG